MKLVGRFGCVATTAILLTFGPASVAVADDIRDRSWQLTALHVADAQRITAGAGVIVAVVDTGVSAQQSELAGSLLKGTDATDGLTGDGWTDKDGHGTGIAALIAGHGRGPDFRSGVIGIAPSANILPVTAIHGAGPDTDFSAAITWAVAHGARVICVALIGSETAELKSALDLAFAADIVVVAGTGNHPRDDTVGYPARYPGVVAVTATDETGTVAGFSVTGPEAVLSAPGAHVPVPGANGVYGLADGTSVSTALVAGVAALVRSKYPTMSARDVIHRLEVTADDKGAPGRDPQYGYGIVNPVRALTADVPPLADSASATPAASVVPDPATGAGHTATLVLTAVVILALLAAGAVTVAVKIRR